MRERYAQLMARPDDLEDVLLAGAAKARAVATPFLAELRAAVGLRSMRGAAPVAAADGAAREAAPPAFKQYREADGRFHFKLVDGERVLLQSAGFDGGRDAGQWVARLKREGAAALAEVPASYGEGVDAAAVLAALAAIASAEAAAEAAKAAAKGA